MTTPIRVFVTYAWEDEDYKILVEQLALRLINDGVDARLDVWHLEDGSITGFMNSEVRNADKILMLCSPSYQVKVHAMEDGKRPSGSGWESSLAAARLFHDKTLNGWLVPVLTRGEWKEAAPDWVLDYKYVDFRQQTDDLYKEILYRLTGKTEPVNKKLIERPEEEESEKALPPKHPERYQMLAVFPPSAEIPVDVLVGFWKVRHEDTMNTINELHNRNKVCRTPDGHVSLNESQRCCLRRPRNQKKLHGRLVDSLRPESRYRLQFEAYHLIKAGRDGECQELLCSADRLNAQIDDKGLLRSLASDLKLAMQAKLDLSAIAQSLVDTLGNRNSTPWHELRLALVEAFGIYDQWPEELRKALEENRKRQVRIFVGDTLDKEGAYEKAAECFQRLLDDAGGDVEMESDGFVRLAIVRRHQGRHDEALKIIEHHLKGGDAGGCYGARSYHWIRYHRAISLKDCGWHSRAREVLKQVAEGEEQLDTDIKHQLAVVQLELLHVPLQKMDKEALENARVLLEECLAGRKATGDWRFIYELRRLGQVYALSGEFDRADSVFSEAEEEAQRRGDHRNAGLIGRDREAFVTVAQRIIEKGPHSKVHLDVDPEFFPHWRPEILHDAFRVAAACGITYLPLIENTTGKLLNSCACWETVHSDSPHWHPTVTVLIFSQDGRLAVQHRQEAESHGKLDASVTGHQEVGATDLDTAIREAREELELALERSQLRRLGKPYAFSKRGSPDVHGDCHENARVFRYKREVCNWERTSVFIAILNEDQVKHLESQRDIIEWWTWQDLRDRASPHSDTSGCASCLRQLLHPDVIAEIEDICACAADRVGIEFFITGPSKSGKATIARRLLESHSGACFDLSAFNRFFAWWALTQSAIHRSGENGNNAERYVWAQSHWVTIADDGQILFSGEEVTDGNEGDFFKWLKTLADELQIEPDGKVFFRGQNITDEMESENVSRQAERQAARTYSYRASLNRLIWKWIGDHKKQGPVFILGRDRSSARTAVRAVYLDSTPWARANRLLPPGSGALFGSVLD